jgi:pyruvate/2-oxoglutarate dehydrogenase complex dihydrolipoamide dehydrogenase (E3) component
MRLASIPPKKACWNEFLDYLERRVRGMGVTLELDKEFTPDLVGVGKPDAVIVASGAVPLIPGWKGLKGSGALSVDTALKGGGDVGKRVLVVGGGGIGAELADYLSEMGKEVTLIEMLEEIASDLVFHLKYYLSQRLAEKRVTILTSTKVKELGKGYALVQDVSGTRKIDGFDTIVLAVGSKSDDRIAKSLEGKVPELYVVGDASEPRETLEALFEGEEVALKI